MSATTCFQKQVGKRKKKDEDTDSDIAAPTTSNSDELMIIDDSNGSGRSERLTKRRKRVDEKDESFDKAVFILENDFSIPVDETMSRKEVIDLAFALLQSKKEEKSWPDPTTSDSGKGEPSKKQEDRPLDEPLRSRTKGQGQTRSTYKQTKVRQDEFSDEDPIPFHDSSHVRNTFYGKTYSREKKSKSVADSKDVYESEGSLPEKKVTKEKTERKRQHEEEPKEESQSSQENGFVTTRPKKSRNLQLNKKQLETMQAKTSSLLKKTAVVARQSQDKQLLTDSQMTSEQHKMANDDDETQAPGSQELFEGETLVQDGALPGTPSSNGSDEEDKHRTLRSLQKEKVHPEKFLDVVWQPYIPMKRTHYTKAAMQRKSKKNESSTSLFAPRTKDAVSYSKVILQLFNIYFHKLSKEQSKMEAYMEWGESVKPGRHMSRTVDAKGRGQDSYPWSSDDDVTIHSGKSSEEENKSQEKQNASKSKARGRTTKTTRSKRLLRSNSDDKGSESDFVSEPQRIQPRRSPATPREPIHKRRVKEEEEEDDDVSLPDFGISSSDKPPEPGQSSYAGETQPMSPVFQTLVDQTLPMDDMYLADTETLEPDIGEVPSDDDDNVTEIQPRRKIQTCSIEEQTDDFDIPMEIHSTKMKGMSASIVTSSSGRRPKGNESPILPPSQGSSGSRGSGSILNSEGEIKSFQKVKPGTFNFDIDDEDSKDVIIEDDDSKDNMNISRGGNEKRSSNNISEDVDKNVLKTSWGSHKQTGKCESSDSETTDVKDKLDQVHDSPLVASTSKRKGKFITKKVVKVDKHEQTTSEDDFFSVGNSDFDESRKGLTVYNLSSDSADEPKPSTSGKDRVIPIVLTDKYEKKTTPVKYASVKPLISTRNRQPVQKSDSADVTQLKQTKSQIACPMCSKMFDFDVVERHASDCLGQQEVTSTTGDDDTAAVGTSAEVHGLHEDDQEHDKGDHSLRPNAEREEGRRKIPLQSKISPYLQHVEREFEQCCVCNEMVTLDLIEAHTNQCIENRMSMMREAEADRQDRRATRSRARDRQGHAEIQPRRVIELEDAESISSEMSDDHDPEWTEPQTVSRASASDEDSPMKFKKISELEEPIMDFKNQFKSKTTAKRGSKRGGSSRGRGRK